jgi:phage-related protein
MTNLIDEKSKVVDGFSYEVVVTQGEPADPTYFKDKVDPKRVFLTVWVIDEVNDMTHDKAVFELSAYCENLDPDGNHV